MTIIQMGVGDTAVTGACGALARAAPAHVNWPGQLLYM